MSSQKPLSAIQTAILTQATHRPDRAVFPLVLDARLVGGARTKVLAGLLTRELVEEVATDLAEAAWRKSEPGQHVTLRLTEAGMIAVGIETPPAIHDAESHPEKAGSEAAPVEERLAAIESQAATNTSPKFATGIGGEHGTASAAAAVSGTTATTVLASPPKSPGGKLGVVLVALGADGGASIDALTNLTGWLPHTTRAALTRLRQRGFPITRFVADGLTTYRLAPQMADAGHAA